MYAASLTSASPYFAVALGATPQDLPTSAALEGHGAAPQDTLDSRDLLQGRKTVTIAHNGSVYRLQATRLGKLILTK
ncbi:MULTISPECIES: hemin uptake protein HemP [Giesbergeria]|uniref:Hemin uptake protein HemP n=1 Tax=Giesbergeria sinuosa TaxID=80883 RepID=A0ABV9QBS5_9BURK